MIDLIIKNSLRHRAFVIAVAIGVILYGFTFFKKLNVDIFPDLNKPTVNIMTEAEGLAPEEVEALVTTPIETVLQGLPGVTRVRSSSGVGLSVVYAEFGWGEEIYRVRQLVSEKLSQIKDRFPQGVFPQIGPISSIMGEIQLIGLISKSEKMSATQVRTFAENVLKPRLLNIPGVSQVISIGGGLKQYQISLSSQKIQEKRLTLEELQHNLTHLSQNTTGGFIDYNNKEYLIRNIGSLKSVEEISDSVVGMHLGKPVLLKEIAEVKESIKQKRGDASVNAKPAVIVSVQKQPGSDTIQITNQIETALKSIDATDIEIKSDLFKQATFIKIAIQNVIDALRDGSLLVLLVLFVFLANFKATFISMLAVPISFVTTFIVLKFFGMSINTMTLGGLAIAVGELVDDAIVDVENIIRRLRELKSEEGILKCIYLASKEIRSSIVLATITVVIVFIPLFQLEGIEGRFFIPLGMAYVISILCSLLVSITVTPALSAIVFKNKKSTGEKESRFSYFLKKADAKLLSKTIEHPHLILIIFIACFAYSVQLLVHFKKDFMPEFNETTATINVITTPGISLSNSNEIGTEAEKKILEVKGVRSVSRRTGRAELDEHAEGVHYSELDVDFDEKLKNKSDVLEEIRNKLKEINGASINIGQPISHRIDHLLSGVRAQIAIKIFGNDLNTIRSKAAEVYHAIKDTDGLVDLQIEQQTLVPQIKIEVNREKAAKYGIVVGDLTSLLSMALKGEVVASIIENKKPVDAYMVFDERSKNEIEAINKTLVKVMPDGERIVLSKIAEVYESTGPNLINHENTQRRMVVQANVSKRGLEETVNEIKEKVSKKVELPKNVYIEYGGQYQNQQESFKKIIFLLIIAIIMVFILIYSNFKSFQITLQILFNIPLAIFGSIIAISLTTKSINLASLIAMITLVGISTRNGIMMISHYLHIITVEKISFSKEMIIKGSTERLIPVLMTALTAILALIPLTLEKNAAGKEILYPVAIVVMGGLISSTLLDIVLTPALFYKYGKSASEKYAQKNAQNEL